MAPMTNSSELEKTNVTRDRLQDEGTEEDGSKEQREAVLDRHAPDRRRGRQLDGADRLLAGLALVRLELPARARREQAARRGAVLALRRRQEAACDSSDVGLLAARTAAGRRRSGERGREEDWGGAHGGSDF